MNATQSIAVRYGFGASCRRNYLQPLGRRLKVEYLRGTGDITVPATFAPAAALQPAQYDSLIYPGSGNSAHGYSITIGLFLLTHFELNARYDCYDRLPNIAVQERVFRTTALGAAWHVTALT